MPKKINQSLQDHMTPVLTSLVKSLKKVKKNELQNA